MSTDFLSLPHELQIQILAHLDAGSLIRSALTCKTIYDILRNSSQLSYILQLHFDGLIDGGTSESHSGLIRSLLHRRQAWLSLNWKGLAAYDMKMRCMAYELVGGAFANTDRHHLEIIWPTLGGRKIERATGVLVRDFAMDPTQDMIAFLEDDAVPSPSNIRVIRIHIRTISNNAVHPQARQSPLECRVPLSQHHLHDIHNVLLQVVRNMVVLYFTMPSNEIKTRVLVWDWTTSELIMDSPFLSRSPLPASARFDFALLDASFCFITHILDDGSVWVYRMPRPGSTSSEPVLLAKFHLPPISMGTQVTHISTHTGPVEAGPLPGTPFMLNDDDRLHVFTITYRRAHLFQLEDELSMVSVNLFVHQRVFTRVCEPLLGKEEGVAPVDVPWDEWGPQNTRILHPTVIQRHWLRYVHGQRLIFPLYDIGDIGDGATSAEILDFSLAAVLSAKGIDISSPNSSCLTPALDIVTAPRQLSLLPPSRIAAKEIPFFQDDVETRLPCVSWVKRFGQPYLGYMIHEDGIVGVTMKNDDSLRLHVYAV